MSKVSIRVNGAKCIGRDGNVFHFVDSIFDHGNGFAGCTGFSVRAVSAEEFDALGRDDVVELLEDAGMHDGKSCAEFNQLVDDSIRYDGIGHLFFDESYCCEAESFFDAWGVDYECSDCIGGGRMFSEDSDYEEIVNWEAYLACKWFEGGKVSFDFAARAIYGDAKVEAAYARRAEDAALAESLASGEFNV